MIAGWVNCWNAVGVDGYMVGWFYCYIVFVFTWAGVLSNLDIARKI